jgi:Cys-tRNA(Pro)/Cys-tRNA(Cys) deacylase
MARKGNTPALAYLRRRNVDHEIHTYELTGDADSYGEAVATELGVEPGRLFKTLVAEIDGQPAVAVVPVSGRLSLKALAKAAKGKRASMADPAAAERWTGYVTGGISPFGQKKRMPVYIDVTVTGFETVFASGGQRGIQIELRPADLVGELRATLAPIAEA